MGKVRKMENGNKKRGMLIPAIFAGLGLAMILAAVLITAAGFPWGILFGNVRGAEDIPDPSPIILDKKDRDLGVIYPGSEQAPGSSADLSEEGAAAQETEPSAVTELPGDKADADKAQSPVNYNVMGYLKIPALKVSQNLLQGTEKQLKYGVGHVVSTALPGETGNCAVAGHRSGPFRYVDLLGTGDKVIIKYNDNTYTYSVYESFTVSPNEVRVLEDVGDHAYTLTLITCTPYLIYNQRLIVRAELTEINGVAPDEFFGGADLVS
jgi:LPXTG-site transpeptidase (sortase) family protein